MDGRRQAALSRMLADCIGPALPPGLSLQHPIAQKAARLGLKGARAAR
jgi:hypothetical protein